MHHHTKFGYKSLSCLDDITQTFNGILNSNLCLEYSKAGFFCFCFSGLMIVYHQNKFSHERIYMNDGNRIILIMSPHCDLHLEDSNTILCMTLSFLMFCHTRLVAKGSVVYVIIRTNINSNFELLLWPSPSHRKPIFLMDIWFIMIYHQTTCGFKRISLEDIVESHMKASNFVST